MIISLGSDHAGYAIKTVVAEHLLQLGHEIIDCGAFDDRSSNYPEFVIPAAEAVAEEKARFAFVFGGSGNGEGIAVNKVLGIRCAVCWSAELAALARRHNDANALSFPGRFVTPEEARKMVDAFLTTEFEGGRHEARLKAVADYECALRLDQDEGSA